jgi:hypothetical protein
MPKKVLAKIMCAVLDTGKNSVRPSTMAKTTASKMFMQMGWFGFYKLILPDYGPHNCCQPKNAAAYDGVGVR